MTKEEIETGYLKFSSTRVADPEEIEFLIKKDCQCDNCCDNILDKYDFPFIDIEQDELLCEDCERELKYVTCSVCEDNFDKPIEPNEHMFFVSKSTAKELSMAMGIYRVRQFPFYYGCLVGGFESFFENAIELVSKTDIQKIKTFQHGKDSQRVNCDYMCPECFDKYTGNTRIKYKYVDEFYSMHMSISMRGMIAKPIKR